jgi:hypothetical protein
MYKVIAPIEKKDGRTFWLDVGRGFPNKDDSINVYLDACPKEMKFQIREMTEEDFKHRERAHDTPPANAVESSTAVPH